MRNISLQKLSKLNRLFIVATLLLGTLGITFAGVGAQSSGSSPSALIIDLDGTINTVATNRVERGLEQAFEEGYNFAIIRIDTPGGTIDATRDIVNLIVDAPLPVITYVAPDGAHAGSAGTFVAAAGHLLVMASVSNIGAASPVSSTGEEIPETLDLKLREDASALLRSIAELRDRNIDALEDTVLNATSYSANEALELGIADFIADNTSSLLTVVDGQTVVVNGLDVTINSVGAALETASFNLFAAFQSIIASPNVAYILLVLGIIGLVLEALFLGGWVAGTIGVILIIVGGFSLALLPFSWLGVVLLILALVLFIIETQAPGFGIFGIGGIVSLVLGGIFLFSSDGALGVTVAVSPWVIGITATILLLLTIWVIWEVRILRKPPNYKSKTTPSNLIGDRAKVTVALEPLGEIYVGGEYWTARTIDDQHIEKNKRVRVEKVDGLLMLVSKYQAESTG